MSQGGQIPSLDFSSLSGPGALMSGQEGSSLWPAHLDQHPPVKPVVKLCINSRAQNKQLLSLDQYSWPSPICQAKAFSPEV